MTLTIAEIDSILSMLTDHTEPSDPWTTQAASVAQESASDGRRRIVYLETFLSR